MRRDAYTPVVWLLVAESGAGRFVGRSEKPKDPRPPPKRASEAMWPSRRSSLSAAVRSPSETLVNAPEREGVVRATASEPLRLPPSLRALVFP